MPKKNPSKKSRLFCISRSHEHSELPEHVEPRIVEVEQIQTSNKLKSFWP